MTMYAVAYATSAFGGYSLRAGDRVPFWAAPRRSLHVQRHPLKYKPAHPSVPTMQRLPEMLQLNELSLPFVAHILVETPACILFFLKPSLTLRQPQPHANAIIRQYALLLFCTNIIVALILLYGQEAVLLRQRVAGALAVYHVGPLVRAMGRVYRREEEVGGSAASGAPMHAVLHTVCAGLLLAEWMAS